MEYREIKVDENSGIVTALFKDPNSAEFAYRDLLNRGYEEDDITLVMSEETHKKHFLNNDVEQPDLKTKSLQGMGVGGAIGTTIGAIAAAVAAIGTSLVIPGLGIVVAGSLAASFAGAGAGAVTGGILGAFIGLGIPDKQAQEYEEGIKAGGVIISVSAKSQDDYKILSSDWKRLQKKVA